MKLMEIFKIRIRCLHAAAPGGALDAESLYNEIMLSRAAQEYYTSGLHARDRITEIKNAVTHQYLYDGHPTRQQGEIAMLEKYHLSAQMTVEMSNMATALADDIQNGYVRRNGTVDLSRPSWIMADTLKIGVQNTYPNNPLTYVVAQMLAQEKQAKKR